MTSKAPDTALKHLTEAAKRQPAEGTHPATKAALRRPAARDSGRPVQYTRIDRGHTA